MKEDDNIFQPTEPQDEKIIMNAEYVDPNPSHQMSVQNLLVGYLSGLQYPFTNLASIVVNQKSIGTMITQSEDVDAEVLAFATIINLTVAHDEPSIKAIHNFVVDTCNKHMAVEDKEKMINILSHNKVGLLLNERVINFPYEGIPNLHDMLKKDYQWTLERPDVKLKETYMYDYLLYITTITKQIDPKNKKKVETDEYIKQDDIEILKVRI